jgi:hypothetical protein
MHVFEYSRYVLFLSIVVMGEDERANNRIFQQSLSPNEIDQFLKPVDDNMLYEQEWFRRCSLGLADPQKCIEQGYANRCLSPSKSDPTGQSEG